MERVYAAKDIKRGEEITVLYMSERTWAKTRASRQQLLLQDYGFTCCCQVCAAPASEAAASDERREKYSNLDAAIGDGILIMLNPSRALRNCRDISGVRRS